MKRKLPLPAFLIAAACALIAPASAQIAITEFLANPMTLSDNDGEFVELFNYVTEAVNLKGWTVSHEDIDSELISESDLFVSAGGYLVIAKNKTALEGAFFGGVPQLNIVDVPGLTLKNGHDEIVISDSEANIIWSVAYPSGEANGAAAFLSEDDFTTVMWGSKATPGIDFTDIDPASATLGYQNNNTTTDPNASAADEDTASPLAGFYTSGGPGPVDENFRITSIVPGAVEGSYDITFNSEDGETYSLESSPDLKAFMPVAPVTGEGTSTTVPTEPAPAARRMFYRIRKTTIVIGM